VEEERMLGGVISIIGGVIAASGFIIARKPNAKELIDKLTPYQGWIGVVMFWWGLWEMFGVIRNMGLMTSAFTHWLFWLLTAISDLGVGFLLGFGLISKYLLERNATAKLKGQEVRASMVRYQVPLGFTAIAMGVLFIVL
jgi:hypothetical protein